MRARYLRRSLFLRLVLDPGIKEYASVQFQGKMWNAHRFVYNALVQKVSKNDDVHHKCENKPCIRPEHLERLGRCAHVAIHDQASFQRNKTHCPHGHEYTVENTIARNGRRECRECSRIGARERWRAKHWL